MLPRNISRMHTTIAGIRPLRSAYAPSTTAPSGRARKDAAKVPVVNSIETVGSSAGKYLPEMMPAISAYTP